MKCQICQSKDYTMYSRFRVDGVGEISSLVGIYICGKHGATEEDLQYLRKSGVLQEHIDELLPGLIEYTLTYRQNNPAYYEEVKKAQVEHLELLKELLSKAKKRVPTLEAEIESAKKRLEEYDA